MFRLQKVFSLNQRAFSTCKLLRQAVVGFEEATKQKSRDRPIYLDMQATTPMDPRVLDAMLPYMTQQYGNPHSRTHQYGWESEEAVEVGREVIISCNVGCCQFDQCQFQGSDLHLWRY